MKKAFFFFAAAILALTGCPHAEHEEIQEQVVNVDEIPHELMVPTQLWDLLQGKIVGAKAAEQAALSEDGAGALFMPVDVIVESKNAGVVKDERVRIHLPRGGGLIDFKDILSEEQGSFFVRFEWPEVEEPEKNLDAWFLSKARKRKIGDELWGSGCKSFFKITKGLAGVMKAGGLKLNTTRNLHLSVLGGSVVFSTVKNGQTFLSQVSFKDSRHPDYFCEGF